MAINATPQYKKAEDRYRAATSPADRVAALEEMFRLVPKHKASEKLQQQIKQKLKTAREEMQKGPKSGGSHGGAHDIFNVPKQGAGQVVLLGAPNVGKSSILGALTHAKVEIAEFPFSTHAAIPGMAHHEDVPIQLVDMPPIMDGQGQPGMAQAYRRADAILIVIDLAAIELVDQFEQAVSFLKEHSLRPVSTVSSPDADDDIESRDLDAMETAVFAKRTIVVANKLDAPGAKENFDTLRELVETDLKMIPISTAKGDGLPEMMAALFGLLDVIRVYAKKPGKPADMASPFVLPVGSTVMDMAEHVHKEVAEKLKTARIWGGTVHDGQQVTGTHVLTDKNTVELHV